MLLTYFHVSSIEILITPLWQKLGQYSHFTDKVLLLNEPGFKVSKHSCESTAQDLTGNKYDPFFWTVFLIEYNIPELMSHG